MNKTFVEQLRKGKIVQFRPHGNSMSPKIKSGQLVTISPDILNLEIGDIVFCKVYHDFYVHLLTGISSNRLPEKAYGRIRYQISNNKRHVNGWIKRENIFGKVIKIED